MYNTKKKIKGEMFSGLSLASYKYNYNTIKYGIDSSKLTVNDESMYGTG